MSKWKQGQLVVSRTEPELGVGEVVAVTHLLEVSFSASSERRFYAGTPPLQRFRLQVGEVFFAGEGFVCESVEIVGDFLRYHAQGKFFWEYEIKAQGRDLHGALPALLAGNFSAAWAYDLRREAWQLRAKSQQGRLRGLVGARVQPLPHQLYIAATVARRANPRVLLADEVGLGKTVEAGLIFAAMRSLERAERVLIISPAALVYQWLAELQRYFGELFTVFDRERYLAEALTQGDKPLSRENSLLVSLDFCQEPDILAELAEQDWDLLIVDEAHHLDWDEDETDPAWLAVYRLSQVSHGLLLLTATPRKHGLWTLFGLLRLIDAQRFHSFVDFVAEQELLEGQAALAQAVLAGEWQDFSAQAEVLLSDDHELWQRFQSLTASEDIRRDFVTDLVDRHGTGRVFIRNRRANLEGFPRRVLHPVELSGSLDVVADGVDDRQLLGIAVGHSSYKARRDWLLEFLRGQQKKVLVLCSKADQVRKLGDYLAANLARTVGCALFHEEMSLLERDRQAAWFMAPDGARILICSEVGGEGRNFQFTDTLVLFDLPRLPDLLEQRIGRIDRIGQGKEINIYVMYTPGTPEEVLYAWYARGLSGFTTSGQGADPLLEDFAGDLLEVMRSYLSGECLGLADLLERTRSEAERLRESRKRGADVLLDMNSFDAEVAGELLEDFETRDDNPGLELFVREVFDRFGVDYDDHDDRGTILLRESQDFFPDLGLDGDVLLTFDRNLALQSPQMIFLSQDHPVVEACLARFLERNEGIASVCRYPRGDRDVHLQVSLLLQAQGPRYLELGRYLAPLTKEYVRSLVGEGGEVLDPPYQADPALLQSLEGDGGLGDGGIDLAVVVERELAELMRSAQVWVEAERAKALARLEAEYVHEKERLEYLGTLHAWPAEEVAELEELTAKRRESLQGLECRLDALRVVFVGE